MLEDAARVLSGRGSLLEPQQIERDIVWITGQCEDFPGLSFIEIAEAVGCDPDRLRSQLLRSAEEFRLYGRKGPELRNLHERTSPAKIKPRRRKKAA